MAYELDGNSSSYIDTGVSVDYSVAGRYTFTCRVDSVDANYFVGSATSGQDSHIWGIVNSTQWRFRTPGKDSKITGSTYGLTPTVGEYYNFDVSWDGSGSLVVICNGITILDTTGHWTGTISLRLYRRTSTGNRWAGVIKEFKYYDTDQSTILNYWKIDDNDTTIVDSVGTADSTLIQGSGTWNFVEDAVSSSYGFLLGI